MPVKTTCPENRAIEAFLTEFSHVTSFKAANKLYRKFALAMHPDKEGGSEKAQKNLEAAFGIQKMLFEREIEYNFDRLLLRMQFEKDEVSLKQKRYAQPFKALSYLITAPFFIARGMIQISRVLFFLIPLGFMRLMNALTFGESDKIVKKWMEEPGSVLNTTLEAFGARERKKVFYKMLKTKEEGALAYCFPESEENGIQFFSKHRKAMTDKENESEKLSLTYAIIRKQISVWGGMAYVGFFANAFWRAFKLARFSKPWIVLAALICIPVFTVIQIARVWMIEPVFYTLGLIADALSLAMGEFVTLPIRILDVYRAWSDRKSTTVDASSSPVAVSPSLSQLGAEISAVERPKPANEKFHAPFTTQEKKPKWPDLPRDFHTKVI